MNTVLHATDSAEFLGLVPALAGFTPRQSIVLLPFVRSRAHGAMRIDLPQDDVDLHEYVDTSIGLVSRVSGTDALAVVVYADESAQFTPDGMILPASVVVEHLLSVAADSGLHIVDALCVTPGGWSSYLDDDPELYPIDEIPAPPAIPGALDVSGDQGAGAVLPDADFAEKERVGRALHDLSDVVTHDGASPSTRKNPQAIAASLMLDDLPLFFESVLEETEGDMPPFICAALIWCLERPPLRDAALAQWASDLATGIAALDAQLSYAHEGVGVPSSVGQIFLGQGVAPDPDRLRAALNVVRAAAARAPRVSRPGPLTVAAWLSWALGRSTHASSHLRAVAEIDPDYSLARLISTLIDNAVLPEWTFRRPSA